MTLELVLEYLESPSSAVPKIIERRPLGAAALILILALFSRLVAHLIIFQIPSNLAVMAVTWGFLIVVCIGFTFWGLMSAGIHLICEALGGEGRVMNLSALLGFSALPFLAAPVVALLCRTTAVCFQSIHGGILYAAGIFGLLIWSTVLLIRSVKGVYRFSTARAVFATVAPFLLLLSVFLAVLLLAALGIAAAFLMQMR